MKKLCRAVAMASALQALCSLVVQAQTAEYLNIRSFGGAPDAGLTDNTPALNAAIATARVTGATILFPTGDKGVYSFKSRPVTIGSGVCIMGPGSAGSTPGIGVTLEADYNETAEFAGFLTWDGSYNTANGTGGCLKNITLKKGLGFTGGTGVVITGTDDLHRNSWFRMDHVVINASKSSSWHHNIVVDGSCCTTSASQGIRDITFTDVWVTQSSVPNQYILFKNIVQFMGFGIFAFPATGAPAGITVTGNGPGTSASTGVFFSSSKISGNLVLDQVNSFSWCCDISGTYSDTKNSQNIAVFGNLARPPMSDSPSSAFYTDLQTSLRSGSTANTDLAGQLTLVNGVATYPFKGRYNSPPICTASDTSAAHPVRVTTSTAGLAVAGTSGHVINFICVVRK
jgi:hypothetical protein